MRSPVRAFVALLLAAAVVFGGAAAPASAYDESTIHALVNDARAQNGLGGLVRNSSLDAVALQWARQLAVNGTLSHNPSVGAQIPGGWRSWGENVAQGYGSGSAVHNGWMNSSGHRANILGGFTDIGIALIEGGGTTWAVEVFASYPGSGLPAPAPPAAVPAPAAPAPAAPAPAAPAPAVPAPAAPATQAPAPATPETAPPASAEPVPSALQTRAPRPEPTERALTAPAPTSGAAESSLAASPPLGGIAISVLLGALAAAAVARWGVVPWMRRRRS